MAGPWDNYAQPQAEPTPGPWQQYQQPQEKPPVAPLSMADPLMAGPRIKRAFDEGVGDEPFGMSQETFEFFQKMGLFREAGQPNGLKSVMQGQAESILYPAFAAADMLYRVPGGLYRAAQQAAIEWGAPKDVASIPDAFMGTPHPMGVPRPGEIPRAEVPKGEATVPPEPPPPPGASAIEQTLKAAPEAASPEQPVPAGQSANRVGQTNIGFGTASMRAWRETLAAEGDSDRAEAMAAQADPIQAARAADIIAPRPEVTAGQTPHEMAEQAYPRSLSAAAPSHEEVGPLPGHKPGEYDARGKEWVSKIDAPADVREAVERIAQDNDWFPEARGGVASPEARAAVAEAAGIAPGELDADHFATHFDNDGKVRAVIQAVRQTASDVAEASARMVKEPSVENAAALAEAEMRHGHVLEYVMGKRAESGRSLAAWKDLLRQTERSKAKVAIAGEEQAGKAPTGTGNVLDAVHDLVDNLGKDKPPEKLGIGKLIEQAKALVDEANKPPSPEATGPRSPEVQGLVDEAKKVLRKWAKGGNEPKDAAELDAFRQRLDDLAKGNGKIGDVVNAARDLLKKNEKPEPKEPKEPKAPSERGRLMGAAKRLVDTADNAPKIGKEPISGEMQELMEAARQAIGRLKNLNKEGDLTEFRSALRDKDFERAAAAANRLIEGEAQRPAGSPKPPVEHDVVMSAARRVVKAAAEHATKERPALPPDIVEVLDEAKNAVKELGKVEESGLSKLVEQAERQAANLVKQKAVKEPAEALPPELQALVDKAKRVVNRFGGIDRGEKAAMLLARTGKTATEQERLARSVAGLTPNQVAKVLEKLRNSPQAKQPGWFFWLWQQGLISGLVTHTGYAAVNTATVFLERSVSPFLAAAVDRVRGGNASMTGPLYANVAMVQAAPDAVRAASEAFRTGNRVPLASEMRLFERGEESPQTKGSSSAYVQGPSPDWGIWKRVFNEDQLDKAARVLGIPGRAANLMHTFYKVLSERGAASNIAFEKASAEGLKGDKFWERYRYHLANPTDEALAQAVNDAYSGAFMSKLDGFPEKAANFFQNTPFRWLLPFQHIPYNIVRMGVEYSPLKILGPEMRDALLGKKGAPAQNLAIAKMAVGSTLMTYVMHKVFAGEMTGDYPTDPGERKDWVAQGIQPNSMKLAGQWVSMERLGGVSIPILLGANLAQIIRHWDGKGDASEEVGKAAWGTAHAMANILGSEVGFQTLRNVMEAAEDEKKAQKFVALQASSFMPFSAFIGQNASIIDPQSREVKGIIDGLKYRIPVVRESLLPKRDPVYGEPVPNPGYHTLRRMSPVDTDPVKLEMQRLQYHPTRPEDRINGVKLTPEVYDRYEAVAGAQAKQNLHALMDNAAYQGAPDFLKREMVANSIKAARGMAGTAIIVANPKILGQGLQQSLDWINGASPTKRPKKAPELTPTP